MRDLLPAFAVCEEAVESDSTAPLHPREEAWWRDRSLAPKRWSEIRAGRACARRALASLGILEYALLPGPSRAPVWPASIVGSITHCEGYCAAVVTSASEVLGLGIDAESHGSFPLELADRAAARDELVAASRLVGSDQVAACLIFSAKESVYKALHPITGEFLDFHDLVLALDGAGGFAVEAIHTRTGHRMRRQIRGRYRVDARYVMTAALLSA